MRYFFIFCTLLLTGTASAQVDRSSVSGTVTDPHGSRIPGARITAFQSATGLERKTETSAEGTYMLDGLPVGSYVITFSKPGFSVLQVERVDQGVGETRVLNGRLRIDSIAGKTTVTEPLVHMDTTSAVVGAPIEQTQLRELPLNGRNWSSLTALSPGANDNGASDQRTIRFAGHGLDDNNFLFDGVDASGVLNQAQKEYVRLAIPLESIAQFQVQAQNFDAGIGMTAGGQISVASPAGTNVLHGSLFDYFRNTVFDSRSPFDGVTANPFLLNQFGAAVGGAIVQNQTFFYANYAGLRQRRGQVQIGLVPSSSFLAQAQVQSPGLSPILSSYPKGTSPT